MRPQKPSHEPHGTNGRYIAGCSCIPCCDAHAAYMREARDGRTYRRQSMSTKQAQQHVRKLLESLTVSEVARRSGVDRITIRGIRDGKPSRVHRRTIEAIRGVVA